MKRMILAGALALTATGAMAQGTGSNPKGQPAGGYTTSGGTAPQQTNPNSNQTGTRSNANPYTGTGGTRTPKN